MTALVDQMKVVLATTFSAYLKAHNYHWNVTGPNFSQYHSFFGDYYSTVWGSVDGIAEHIRSLDAFVPGSYTRFSELTKIQDELSIISPEAMFRNLYEANETIRVELNSAHVLATAEQDHGLINFIEGLLDYHAKMHWQIRAFISRLAPAESSTE